MNKHISILFIGNSHTYYNDMPCMVSRLFASAGTDARVTMMTKGGKELLYHCERKDVIFNIKYGRYDYVILQGKATDFVLEDFMTGIEKIKENALDYSDTKPILYMIWANQSKHKTQPVLTDAYCRASEYLNAPIAPAGEVWQKMLRWNKDLALYRDDGNHATPLGSYLAASCIFYAISRRERPIRISDDTELNKELGLDTEVCKKIQSEACRMAKKYRK